MGILKRWCPSTPTYLQVESVFSASAHTRKILPDNCIYTIKINGCGEVTFREGSTFSYIYSTLWKLNNLPAIFFLKQCCSVSKKREFKSMLSHSTNERRNVSLRGGKSDS